MADIKASRWKRLRARLPRLPKPHKVVKAYAIRKWRAAKARLEFELPTFDYVPLQHAAELMAYSTVLQRNRTRAAAEKGLTAPGDAPISIGMDTNRTFFQEQRRERISRGREGCVL